MKISEKTAVTALKFGGAFLVMTAALLYLFLGDTAVAQSIRLSRIRKYRDYLEQKLAAEPRFKTVKVVTSTTNSGGTLVVLGGLPNTTELEALKAFIAATHPPAHVDYRLSVPDK